MTHTPGPWKVEIPSDHRGATKIRSGILFEGATDGVEVAQIVGRLGYKGDAPCGNYRANAQLIAAAPLMYETLEAIIRAEQANLVEFIHSDVIELAKNALRTAGRMSLDKEAQNVR
jgi:hypothetical protein